MPIDVYGLKYSPPCRAVYMTAKHLNIDLNEKVIDLSKGEHLTEDYLKINPGHSIPVHNDNGFTLVESRAIMQYLCNQYAPNSTLYPKDPRPHARVDRLLNFDLTLFKTIKESRAALLSLGVEPSEMVKKLLNDSLKVLDQLIGDNKYLVGNHLTIADLSVLATTSMLNLPGESGLSDFPHLNTWYNRLQKELPYFDSINMFSPDEFVATLVHTQ